MILRFCAVRVVEVSCYSLGEFGTIPWQLVTHDKNISKNEHSECVNDSFHTLIYLPRVKFVKSKVSLTN